MTVRFLTPLRDDRVDQGLGNAAQAEAAGHDRHVVVQQARERGPGVTVDLSHGLPPEMRLALG